MSLSIEQRIFIVGAPRSGTTLLQSLLAAHDRATSFTESHFFSRSFRALPSFSSALLRHDPLPRLREFLAENETGALGDEIEQRVRTAASGVRPLRTKAVARAFLEALDQLALARGRGMWIEKTPLHLRFVPFLDRISAAPTRFIHLIRSGVDVVSSLHRASQHWERAYGIEECVRRWNDDVAFSLTRAGSPSDAFVLYEHLTADPEAALRGLFSATGLDWQPGILERYAQEAARLTTAEETWKSGVDAAIRPSRASEQSLTAEQRERVRNSVRDDLYKRAEQLAGR